MQQSTVVSYCILCVILSLTIFGKMYIALYASEISMYHFMVSSESEHCLYIYVLS